MILPTVLRAELERIERLPGVRHARHVNVLPFSTYDRGGTLFIDGAAAAEGGREPSVSCRVISPRYLEVMKIPILEGQSFITARPDGAEIAFSPVQQRTDEVGKAAGKPLRQRSFSGA